ncbi:MAG: vitamin B12-dependent ribonucleotide reductase, partial [Ignavibacteria bacterium]
MKITRRFTTSGTTPYDMFRYTVRESVLRNQNGKEIFRMENIEVPEAWSQVATDILAQKYFRKAGVPQVDAAGKPMLTDDGAPLTGAENSVRQVVHRLAGCWRWWGEKYGYFDTAEDAQAFYDEIAFMLLKQMSAPNSPQWFNTGLNYAYGITGSAQGHQYVDPDTKKLTR